MPKTYGGGSEKPMMQKRKTLTEAGYPEYARTAQEYTDPVQAIKTAEELRKLQDKNKKYW